MNCYARGALFALSLSIGGCPGPASFDDAGSGGDAGRRDAGSWDAGRFVRRDAGPRDAGDCIAETIDMSGGPSGSLLDSRPIRINGEPWTFRTPPPPEAERTVLATHPRLFLTQANLAEMRDKLADPVYAADMSELRAAADDGDALSNALLYQLEGDASRGMVAKDWLLGGASVDVSGLEVAGDWVEPILVFDWIVPLLSSAEQSRAFDLLRENFGWDHRTASPVDASLYWNDIWARLPGLHYPILALAIAGDGIDDVWAQEVLDLVYDESPLVVGPYGATRGDGFLDMLASVSLDDGGGSQAGTFGTLGNNYYTMYLHSFLPMGAWETATGQPMWSRSDFFRMIPSHWAAMRHKTPNNLGRAMPEFLTGIYRDIDRDAAALARWEVDRWGRHSDLLVYRMVLGDLRIAPLSPEELCLPTATYIRGSDLFVSSRSWDEDVVTVSAYSRYLDSNRYEPGSGLFAITRGGEPLAVPAEPNKTSIGAGYFSGLWIYDPSDVSGSQTSTYWSEDRGDDAYTVASESVYFPGGPDRMVINEVYRGISTEYSRLISAPGVRSARQTIVHIMDVDRDFVVVYNRSEVPSSLERAWTMRLAVTPTIDGAAYTIPGMRTTVVAPADHTMRWVGGLNNEFIGPRGDWYGNNRSGNGAGYSADPDKALANGIGNLFVEPGRPGEVLEFLVVIEVGDEPPAPVSRISDREVNIGGWQVSFTPDGDFTVTP